MSLKDKPQRTAWEEDAGEVTEKQEVKEDDLHMWSICQNKTLAAHTCGVDCEAARSQKAKTRVTTQSLVGDGMWNVKDRKTHFH